VTLRWRLAPSAAVARRMHDLRRRLVLAYMQLPFVRRRLRRQAIAAWAGSRTIVFICLGNICRSPFAELLARQIIGEGKIVSSAGYFPKSGRRAPSRAVESARLWGIDLTAHRSRVLTNDLIEEADAIFVFDYDNHRNVVSGYPAARGKVHYAGALAERGPFAIEDPIGRSAIAFETTYQLIANIVDAAVKGPPP
jgi:protein-tyrosine-phosphatase